MTKETTVSQKILRFDEKLSKTILTIPDRKSVV